MHHWIKEFPPLPNLSNSKFAGFTTSFPMGAKKTMKNAYPLPSGNLT